MPSVRRCGFFFSTPASAPRSFGWALSAASPTTSFGALPAMASLMATSVLAIAGVVPHMRPIYLAKSPAACFSLAPAPGETTMRALVFPFAAITSSLPPALPAVAAMAALVAMAARRQKKRKMGSGCIPKKIGSRPPLGNGFAAQLFPGQEEKSPGACIQRNL